MLHEIELKKDNIISLKAEGEITKNDIQQVEVLMQDILNKGKKVRWYVEMENFKGWDLTGFWEDLKVDATHANDYERIAMVGEKKWQEWMTQLMKPFTSANIKYFDLKEKEQAKKWIATT